jgi:small subunit ribosomal protein S5
MPEEKIEKQAEENSADKKAADAPKGFIYSERKRSGGPMRKKRTDKERSGKDEEFEQRVIDLARVTRVMAGGKRMRFRACVAIGDKKGKIGIGIAKGADVTLAVSKAVNKAKKDIINVSIINNTIPHSILKKYGASKVLLKPGSKGRGVIAGGAVRIILELAGIKNVTSKILGTNNKVTNVKCVIEALKSLKKININKIVAEDKK